MVKNLLSYCKGVCGAFLWLLSLVTFISAWVASLSETGMFLGLPVAHLYWDALVLGVLAIGVKVGHPKHVCAHGEQSTVEAK
ncbi:MAG: hypothetical protein AAB454_01665 [Patescibacteria group bacterium]